MTEIEPIILGFEDLNRAFDSGYQKGYNEGYKAGLQYAIEKAKEHLTPKGEDNI